MDPHFHRILRTTRDLADLAIAHAHLRAQHEDQPLALGQSADRRLDAFDHLLAHHLLFWVGPRGNRQDVLLLGLVNRLEFRSLLAQFGRTAIGGDAVEPSAKSRFGAKGTNAFESGDKNVLRQVLGIFVAARHIAAHRAFQVLSRFLFSWEDVQRPIASLSGGEKSRVQLAKLVLADVNFLLLDEPTNHLDIQSREQVEEALEEFDGAILAISHDRYFLDRIVDRIVEVATPSLKDHPGNFSDYWRRQGSNKQPPPRAKKDVQRRTAPRTVRNGDGEAKRLETRIETLEGEKRQLESDLAAAFSQQDSGLGDKLSQKLRRLNDDIETLYREWERVA